ncbi:hypothetical protein GVAV_001917 [Gurleya vavrai]
MNLIYYCFILQILASNNDTDPNDPTPAIPIVPIPVNPAVPVPGNPGVPTAPLPGVPALPLPGVPLPGVPTVPLPGVSLPGVPTLPLPGNDNNGQDVPAINLPIDPKLGSYLFYMKNNTFQFILNQQGSKNNSIGGKNPNPTDNDNSTDGNNTPNNGNETDGVEDTLDRYNFDDVFAQKINIAKNSATPQLDLPLNITKNPPKVPKPDVPVLSDLPKLPAKPSKPQSPSVPKLPEASKPKDQINVPTEENKKTDESEPVDEQFEEKQAETSERLNRKNQRASVRNPRNQCSLQKRLADLESQIVQKSIKTSSSAPITAIFQKNSEEPKTYSIENVSDLLNLLRKFNFESDLLNLLEYYLNELIEFLKEKNNEEVTENNEDNDEQNDDNSIEDESTEDKTNEDNSTEEQQMPENEVEKEVLPVENVTKVARRMKTTKRQ